jgi:ribosomal protein S12 methylthiotransferase
MTKKQKTLSFINLGCFKNIVDTEVLGGLLKQNNIKIVSSYEDSDWLVINTCGFIQDAKEESIDEILRALERKEKGEIKHVAVFGCLIQRYYRELKKHFKRADIIWGVNDLRQLATLISRDQRREYDGQDLFLYSDQDPRILTTTPNTTFIKISEGCDMSCSFCVIPRIRGPYRSRPIPSIVKEARQYLELGFQELNIISQNTSFFGMDIDRKPLLSRLLKELSVLGFKWIRVLYLMPEEVDNQILDSFGLPSILPYFDLPFQHVSAPILKAMKRGGGAGKNMQLIRRIRDRYPETVIRSSFIVGFPGESESDFKELMKFAEESAIERIGVFGFSAEEDTEAFGLKDRVEPNVIEERKNRLMDISDNNVMAYNQRILNTTHEFLPLGPWENYSTIGRISSQSPEVDGLTRVNVPFNDRYDIQKITISGFQNEFIFGDVK